MQRFFAEGLQHFFLQPQFHALSDMRALRKEISESMALLDALEVHGANLGDGWHVVDLCCGKSITPAIVAARHPSVHVVAVDKISGRMLPHYSSHAGCNVMYQQLDVLDESFLTTLQKLVRWCPEVVLTEGVQEKAAETECWSRNVGRR